jgi:hypothetical protein
LNPFINIPPVVQISICGKSSATALWSCSFPG